MQSMLDLTDQISEAQTYIERAEAMLGEITEEYFDNIGTNNPDTPKGRSNIISGFEQNRIIAEIARDYAVQTRQVLTRMERRVKAETVKVLTGEVRLSRVNVVTPTCSVEPDGVSEYSVTLLIPKTDALTKADIDSAIQAAFLDVWARNRESSRTLPPLIHDGDGISPSGDPFGTECRGCWVLTATTKIKPQIVGMDNITKEIPASDIYSGMYGRVTIYFRGYYDNSHIGVGCTLGNIMKTRDGEPLDGKGDTYSFEAIARAGARLAQSGKMTEALALLAKYGVKDILQLMPEQCRALASDLAALLNDTYTC